MIKTPIMWMTKGQVTEWGDTLGVPFEITYSCYEGKEQHCGQCKACFRKWVALENNGIITGVEYWQKVPWEAPWLDEILLQIFNGGYRGKEDQDIVESVQLGVSSESYNCGRYSPEKETGVHHFHYLSNVFQI